MIGPAGSAGAADADPPDIGASLQIVPREHAGIAHLEMGGERNRIVIVDDDECFARLEPLERAEDEAMPVDARNCTDVDRHFQHSLDVRHQCLLRLAKILEVQVLVEVGNVPAPAAGRLLQPSSSRPFWLMRSGDQGGLSASSTVMVVTSANARRSAFLASSTSMSAIGQLGDVVVITTRMPRGVHSAA